MAFFRLNFSTAISSNAVSICISIGLTKVTRLEVSTRYLIHWEQDGLAISPGVEEEVCKYVCCMLTTKSHFSQKNDTIFVLYLIIIGGRTWHDGAHNLYAK